MYLLDTSAWIYYLNQQPLSFEHLQQVVTCPIVIQEVLQGIRDEKKYKIIKAGLLALPCFPVELDLSYHIRAADIYRLGRKKGYTIRSSNDCLIASIALEYSLTVMHIDRDFDILSNFTNLSAVRNF